MSGNGDKKAFARRRDGEAADQRIDWSRDIVAPRQEVSVLSMLYEAAEIQDRLKAQSVTADDFLRVYQAERTACRKTPGGRSTDLETTAELTGWIALFGAQAAASARHSTRGRALLHCAGPDRKGAIADLAAEISREGGNIEGALMSVVAGHLITIFLVSDLGAGLREIPAGITVDVAALETEDVDWPRPGSSCWHARAEIPSDVAEADEALLLRALTSAVAEKKLPLVTLASWPDPTTGNEVVDLNFALAPDATHAELTTIRDLEVAVSERVPKAKLDIFPVAWPTQFRSHEVQRETKRGKRDLLITVSAHARPGFVHSVLQVLTEEIEPIEKIRGSTMAILEGTTVLTAVVKRGKCSSVGHLKRLITSRMADLPVDSPQVQVIDIGSLPEPTGEALGPDDSTTTHELRLQVPEQPGVVTKVAARLKEQEVNITWFVSRVQELQVGRRWPICDIQMHLAVTADKDMEVLSRTLRSLTESEGWDEASLTEWNLDR